LVALARRGRPDSRTVVLGAAGAVAGALCGLLGVAGGVVIVPVLTSRRVGMARPAAAGTTISCAGCGEHSPAFIWSVSAVPPLTTAQLIVIAAARLIGSGRENRSLPGRPVVHHS
jgi:hypothetical protein